MLVWGAGVWTESQCADHTVFVLQHVHYDTPSGIILLFLSYLFPSNYRRLLLVSISEMLNATMDLEDFVLEFWRVGCIVHKQATNWRHYAPRRVKYAYTSVGVGTVPTGWSNRKVRYRGHNSPPFESVVNHISSICFLTAHLCSVLISSFHPRVRFSRGIFPWWFSFSMKGAEVSQLV
jgi:hypothetical protein